MYHGNSAKKLVGEVLALAVLDAKKGNQDALTWLYTESCEAYLLLLDAIEPKRFRTMMASRYGLPKGFSALADKPKPLYGELPPLPRPSSPPPPPIIPTTIETVPIINSKLKYWTCQYGFKALLSLPTCPACPGQKSEDMPKTCRRKSVFFQKHLDAYVLDFSKWGARV